MKRRKKKFSPLKRNTAQREIAPNSRENDNLHFRKTKTATTQTRTHAEQAHGAINRMNNNNATHRCCRHRVNTIARATL
jgi:hypothetical protein